MTASHVRLNTWSPTSSPVKGSEGHILTFQHHHSHLRTHLSPWDLDTYLVLWGPRCTWVSGSSQVFHQLNQPLGNFTPGSHSSRNFWMTQANLWGQRSCSFVTGGNTHWPLLAGQAGEKTLPKPLMWHHPLKAKVEEQFTHHSQR